MEISDVLDLVVESLHVMRLKVEGLQLIGMNPGLG